MTADKKLILENFKIKQDDINPTPHIRQAMRQIFGSVDH